MDVDEGDVLRVRDELINTYYPQAVLVGKAGGHLTLAVPKTSDSQAMCTFLQKIEGRRSSANGLFVRQLLRRSFFLLHV